MAALAVAGLLRPEVLIPPRAIVCFLPLVGLAVARTGEAVSLGLATLYVALLASHVPAWLVPTPEEQLAAYLEPAVRSGSSVCVAGIPADLRRHPPGWHDDSVPSAPILRAETAALGQRSTPAGALRAPARGTRPRRCANGWVLREPCPWAATVGRGAQAAGALTRPGGAFTRPGSTIAATR